MGKKYGRPVAAAEDRVLILFTSLCIFSLSQCTSDAHIFCIIVFPQDSLSALSQFLPVT